MPDPSPYLPDDGSIDFQQLTVADFGTFAPGFIEAIAIMGGRRRLPIWGPDNLCGASIIAYQRTWTSEDAAPPAFTDPILNFNLNDGVVLARTDYSSVWDEIEEEPVNTQTFTQLQWRIVVLPNTGPNPWHFLHTRYKEGVRQYESLGTYVEGGLADYWWKGVMPEGFDPEDPLTWPGTAWRITPVPTVSPAPDDATAEEPNQSGYAETVFRRKWPLPPITIGGDIATWFYAPGRIPGVNPNGVEYLQPRFGEGTIYLP